MNEMGSVIKVKLVFITILSLFFGVLSNAQTMNYTKIQVNEKLHNVLNDTIGNQIINQLDLLFFQIATGKIDNKIITTTHADLTLSILEGLKGVENEQHDSLKNYYKKQLIKFYPIATNTYSLSIAFISSGDKKTLPIIKTIINLIVELKNSTIKFSLPLVYHTKKWKSSTIGNITYYYRDTIQLDRAYIFDKKNTIISKKLNVKREQFQFYMCQNYQEILRLLGYEYQLTSATTYRDGYGVEQGFIFSIMNNEDFSHDVFHHYSGKINDFNKRNWIAEEGIACSWGNAYYTDDNGEMIALRTLVLELKKQLQNNKRMTPLTLFEDDTKIFNHIATELSVRSVISGIICNEVENKKGIEGINKMINSGRIPNSMDAYFKVLNELISINKSNFNTKIERLISTY